MRKFLLTLMLSGVPFYVQAEPLNKEINILNKIGYGATEKSLNLIQDKGYKKWIVEQLENPFLYDDSKIEEKYKFPVTNEELFEDYKKHDFVIGNSTSEYSFGKEGVVIRSLMKRASYAINSENRIREMMVWFWFNHFNIGVYTNHVSDIFLNDYENKIREKSLGNFKDLLKMVSHHPSMLYYLNNSQNRLIEDKEDPTYGLNENYAREFLELHTLGVNGGYTQKDVEELTRILTGYTFIHFIDYDKKIKNWDNISYADMKKIIEKNEGQNEYILNDFFLFRGEYHDYGIKDFLGHKIDGTGFDELDKVIDIVAENPKTAEFLSKKIAVYLIGDNPSEEIIKKMKDSYLDSHGDIAKTIKPLLLSEEFLNSNNKIKDTYTFMLSGLKSAIKNNPIENRDINSWLVNFLIYIEADPYFKNTPEGFSVYGKDWLSTARLHENIFYTINLVNRHSTTYKNEYPINYQWLSKLANKKINTPIEAVKFLTSEEWIKR